MRQKIRDMEKENGQIKYEKAQIEKLWKEEQDKNKKLNETLRIIADIKAERDLLMKALEHHNKEREQL